MCLVQGKVNNAMFRVGITELLEDLGAEGDENALVTLVPKIASGHVTVGDLVVMLGHDGF